MGRNHFSKAMFSPYFNSPHYQNESEERKLERKIEKKVKTILSKFGLVKGKNDD
jgi:hypothetical protein